MRIENDIKLDFDDVLIRPKRSSLNSRKEVDLTREFTFKHSPYKWKGIPIMASNMDTTGTFAMAIELSTTEMLVALHKHYNSDIIKNIVMNYKEAQADSITTPLDYMFLSIGTNRDELNRIEPALPYINKIIIDIANGYSEHMIDCIKRIRDKCPMHIIAAGNVVTADMTEALILAGADIVKVGIGSGSACTTRIQTGVGYPQLSAIIECADAAHGLGGHVIADGGCNTIADFAKAFGGGADFVMSGSFFAGHTEGGGDLVNLEDELFVKYYGMSSNTAQEKYNNGLRDYRSSEGRTVLIPYKGPVKKSCLELLGGIRSTCTYVGASKLKELPKRTTFIRVNKTHNSVYERNTIRL